MTQDPDTEQNRNLIRRKSFVSGAFYIGLAIALVVGGMLRLPQLELRPMHLDESIQAFRFGEMIEHGTFDYDPKDGHGPGLLYFTLPLAKLSGVDTYSETSEKLLRFTTVLFGMGLIALTGFGFRRWLGTPTALAGAALVAVSPMMGFYSRYYIMEMPLVFFLLVFLICAWRYLLTLRLEWLIGAGLCGAIMHATKETFGISIVALVIAVILVGVAAWLGGGSGREWIRERLTQKGQIAVHLAIAVPISLVFSALLYSVVFKHPTAIADSYKTYLNYFGRATGPTGHEKPFFYYLELLFYKKMEADFTWSEAITLLLAVVGIVAAFTWRKLPQESRLLIQILALYTIFSFLIYSAIPYKTPWSILSSLHGAIILAGFGFYALLRLVRFLPIQILLVIALGFGLRHLGVQSHHASFPYMGKMPLYAMGARNPYVYNHTPTGFIHNLVTPLQKLLDASDDGKKTVIRIIHPEEAWPVPWYFRDYPINPARVLREVEDDPIIITDESLVDTLMEQLGDEYTFTRANLRENVIAYMFYKQSLFDKAHPDL